MSNTKAIRPGRRVVLLDAPETLLSGLPEEDQAAIREVVGKTAMLEEYDEHGRAVVKFTDATNVIHFIFVDPALICESE